MIWPSHFFQSMKMLCKQHNSLILSPLLSKNFIKTLISFLLFLSHQVINFKYKNSSTKQEPFSMCLIFTKSSPFFLIKERRSDRIYFTVLLFDFCLRSYLGWFWFCLVILLTYIIIILLGLLGHLFVLSKDCNLWSNSSLPKLLWDCIIDFIYVYNQFQILNIKIG